MFLEGDGRFVCNFEPTIKSDLTVVDMRWVTGTDPDDSVWDSRGTVYLIPYGRIIARIQLGRRIIQDCDDLFEYGDERCV